MEKIKQIITSKPKWTVLVIFSYILILGVLKWRLSPDISSVYFLLGGLIGVYFMDGAELLFNIQPSPFRSIVFIILFGAVSFFVVTSSGSMFATGLVLSLYFTLLLLQAEEWQESKNLNTWYSLVKTPPTLRAQHWIVLGTAVLLVLESMIFIL